jgi:5-methylcytosine-specific restriction endonuclease McrA
MLCQEEKKVANTIFFFVLEVFMATKRLDRDGAHRKQFERNKKRIYATQTVCGICGKPVDFSYKYPHPLSPCIDHIVPVAKGGHPSDLDNLQLAHWTCNRSKSDKLFAEKGQKKAKIVSNRVLPLTIDWKSYRSTQK